VNVCLTKDLVENRQKHGTDVQLTAEKLGVSGFREALIREEN
jgi:hypothetical protein